MTFEDYLEAFRRNWWLILGLAATGAIVGLASSYFSSPTYRASSSVYLHAAQVSSPSDLSQVAGYMQYQTFTYGELADKPVIQTRAVEQINANLQPADMVGKVSTAVADGTYSIDITTQSLDRQESINLANSTASTLVEYVNATEPQVNGTPVVQMSVTSEAVDAVSDRAATPLLTMVGLFIGALLGAIAALLPSGRTRRTAVAAYDD